MKVLPVFFRYYFSLYQRAVFPICGVVIFCYCKWCLTVEDYLLTYLMMSLMVNLLWWYSFGVNSMFAGKYSCQNKTWIFAFLDFFYKHISTIEWKTITWQSTRSTRSHVTAHAARLTHASWPHAVSSTKLRYAPPPSTQAWHLETSLFDFIFAKLIRWAKVRSNDILWPKTEAIYWSVILISVCMLCSKFKSSYKEREFILHIHKYIITKQLLDSIGGWPEGYIPINAGHPLHTK